MFGLPVAPHPRPNIWAALTGGLLGNPDEGIRQLSVQEVPEVRDLIQDQMSRSGR